MQKSGAKKWAIHCSTFSAMKTPAKIAYSPTVKCYNLQGRVEGEVSMCINTLDCTIFPDLGPFTNLKLMINQIQW